jgi:two-component system OmpR family response regulator
VRLPEDHESAPVSTGNPLHVLVVEDEQLLRWAISETLAISGAIVSLASDAAAALQALAAAAPAVDVVLLDLCLPDSRDLALLSTIRRRWPHTAVVIMTAHAAPDVLAGARALRVQTILAKPFDLYSLPAILRAAHQRQGQPLLH